MITASAARDLGFHSITLQNRQIRGEFTLYGDSSIDKFAPQQFEHVLNDLVRAERLELHFASLKQLT